MPVTISYKTLHDNKFTYPFRGFISGSSQSGKTSFAYQLLKNQHIFTNNIKHVRYYHPDYLSTQPVEWHTTLQAPVSYHAGLPDLQELCDLEPHTCVVLDDLYQECINEPAIDYLFRVLSGKKQLSVLILSQRYFSVGKFGLNIRSNCNYTVLMRNVDGKLNDRISGVLGLKIPIAKAIKSTYSKNYWPYIFVDSTPRGQVSRLQCFTDIFSNIQIGFHNNGMKCYIINENDFLSNFDILSKNTAIRKNGSYTKDDSEYHSKRPENTEPGCKSECKPECKSESIRQRFQQRFQQRSAELRRRRKLGKTLQ